MSATECEAIFDCRPNILVNDLSASLEFYRSALGFQIGWHWSDASPDSSRPTTAHNQASPGPRSSGGTKPRSS